MTERYCKFCDGWHDLDRPWPHNCLPEPPQRNYALSAPGVISDTMEMGVQSMVDGKIYTSKAAMRKHYRQTGHIEVGNDPARLRPFKRPKPDTKGIMTAIEKAEARFNRGERAPRAKKPW